MALLGASAASVVVPTGASAAPAAASLRCGYPPGRCIVYTNHGTYKPGQRIRYYTLKHVFKAHETVGVSITGHGLDKHFTHKAGPAGGFSAKFLLGKHLKAGLYKISLRGKADGHHLTGHFRVS
jgi:hypothetical protein